ncbi:MAG: Glu/Leu/Phe/Val dehydrogenase [Nitrospinaceae bacterium]|nr:Glu/Leu/Phe/Val dehydrogenase [Nitrospinaceae bacterium]NIR53342.1 Glu/Leu/Phe/Val dehydrogenase [Nitrospinaceae bacterium]NIS83742.1 Glu/Leu/Phe/Val dehydrogenase [Nitrospinaceae bacterium]NIT80541.1 Glu/Leu/Phe/Val dehydrogenase [Nitrospinaceae bacterium]NIU42866.1 Glu/Leu/Phe/Val dehydrogenase [Nitrospinaceae bacterium]
MDNFADEIGPEKVIHIYEPKSKLRAIVVIDNLSLGPAIGGCRMAPDVSTREVFRLARAMTLKNALARLPHGGAKSALLADPARPDKERLIRMFARSIRNLTEYIPGPDMGTDETSMAYMHDEIQRAVGLPKALGGLPLDELGMTGYGVAIAADVASERLGIPLTGARVVIQGFGNVGRAAAKFLIERKAAVIAASDSQGAVVNREGLDVPALIEAKFSGKSVSDSGLGEVISQDELLALESDIFIPAARPDVFNEANQHRLRTRLVLEGANIPITHEAARLLHERGIVVIPDVIANSGGVICAASEYQGMTEAATFDRVKQTVQENTRELLSRVKEEKRPPHDMALLMARERISQAMNLRAPL